MSILIVDQHERMRRMLKSLVEPLDPTVYECADGPAATRLYNEVHPTCVLIDIAMPVALWVETTRTIRQSDPGARVIIVSEHDDPELRKAAADAGACDYVLKENLTTLRDLIEGFPSRSTP